MDRPKKLISTILSLTLSCLASVSVFGADNMINTKIKLNVKAEGEYVNWEGISNVSQFIGPDGEFWFAYNGKKKVTVVSTENGKVKNKVELEKPHDSFGAVCSEVNGDGSR